MYIDYVRVYQRSDVKNGVGCNPPSHPTTDYINRYVSFHLVSDGHFLLTLPQTSQRLFKSQSHDVGPSWVPVPPKLKIRRMLKICLTTRPTSRSHSANSFHPSCATLHTPPPHLHPTCIDHRSHRWHCIVTRLAMTSDTPTAPDVYNDYTLLIDDA